MKKCLVLCGLMLLFGVAEADTVSGFHLGAAVGQVNVDDSDFGLTFDGSDTGFKLFGGYRINQNFAVELAYINGGTVDDSVSGIAVSLESTAFQASVLGMIPVTETATIYARGAFLSWESDASARLGSSFATASSDGDDFSWGAGVQFLVGPIFLRGEYEGADLDGTDFSMISASIVFPF